MNPQNRFRVALVMTAFLGCECDEGPDVCCKAGDIVSISTSSDCKARGGASRAVTACNPVCCNVSGDLRLVAEIACLDRRLENECVDRADAGPPADARSGTFADATVTSQADVGASDSAMSGDSGGAPDTGTSAGACLCQGAGTTFTKDAACPSTFTDALTCSGFASVAIQSRGMDFTPEVETSVKTMEMFADGTTFCGFGCCITIHCP